VIWLVTLLAVLLAPFNWEAVNANRRGGGSGKSRGRTRVARVARRAGARAKRRYATYMSSGGAIGSKSLNNQAYRLAGHLAKRARGGGLSKSRGSI
jgi:hypothetical protein